MDERHWEGLVKQACEIAEDDCVEAAGDWLFDRSESIELAADFMSQYSKVFSGTEEEPPAAEEENVNPQLLSPGIDPDRAEKPSDVPRPDSASEQAPIVPVVVDSNHVEASLAKLTDLVAAMAKPSEEPKRRKLVVKRDELGRIASIEEDSAE